MSEPFHEANERLRERKRIENDKDAEIERLEARCLKLYKANEKQFATVKRLEADREERIDKWMGLIEEKDKRIAELEGALYEAVPRFQELSCAMSNRIRSDRAFDKYETIAERGEAICIAALGGDDE